MLLIEDSSFGKDEIRGLLRDGLTVWSMWSESMSGSCM